MQLRIADLQVTGDILKLRDLAQFCLEIGRRAVQLFRILTLQGELVLAFGAGAADLDRRDVFQENADPCHLGQLGTQLLNDLVRREFALIPRFEAHEKTAGIGAAPPADG